MPSGAYLPYRTPRPFCPCTSTRTFVKISIAIPSLNYGQFLRQCLESIRIQSHGDFEVLIGDGGSTDDSLAIIEEYTSRDSRFRLVSTRDLSQADSINRSLALATGDIHGWLNADDQYLCTDVFEAVVGAMSHYTTTHLVSFGAWVVDLAGRPTRQVRLRYHPRDNFEWMRRRIAVVQPATFWRREVTERFPLRTDLHFVLDGWFFYEAYCEFSWIELSKPVAGIRAHAGNKSTQIISERVSELARLESLKYGRGHWRSGYLHVISFLVATVGSIPLVGPLVRRAIYLTVNSLAYLSFYRLPGM